MKIDEVSISGFGGFSDKETFDLSAKLTVIIGANGAGKSTVYEAVSASLFQKSIRTSRGIKLFHDEGGIVSVNAGNETYTLTRGPNQGAMKNVNGCPSGNFDRWRLGSVFERGAWVAAPTKLLEMISAILDLDKINKAFDKVKRSVSEQEKELSSLAGSIKAIDGQIAKFTLDTSLEVPSHDPAVSAKAEKDHEKYRKLMYKVSALVDKRQDLQNQIKRVPKVLKECPTCKRPFNKDSSSCSTTVVDDLNKSIIEVNKEISALNSDNIDGTLSKLALTIKTEKESLARSERASAVKDAAEKNLAAARETRAALESSFLLSSARCTLHKEAAKVLGPRGLPGFLLETELETISEIASDYASEINPSANLAVTYGEKGIAIEASYGAASYDSCSEGEKRAIDLALFFAFATIANPQGTIFLDEAFDCLDSECSYRAIRLCSTLPFNVVILTHSESVLGAAANAKIYHL